MSQSEVIGGCCENKGMQLPFLLKNFNVFDRQVIMQCATFFCERPCVAEVQLCNTILQKRRSYDNLILKYIRKPCCRAGVTWRCSLLAMRVESGVDFTAPVRPRETRQALARTGSRDLDMHLFGTSH